MAKCAAAGILQGVDEDHMAPDRVLTRAELFVAVARALGLSGSWEPGPVFTDGDSIPAFASEAVSALTALDGIHGDLSGAADPDGAATYASVATVFDDLIGTYITETGSFHVSPDGLTLVRAGSAALSGDTAGTSFWLKGAEDLTVNGAAVTGDVYAVPSLEAVLPETDLNENGLAEEVEGGPILHTWTWSFNTIKEMIPEIAAGFSAIQTSPLSGFAALGQALRSWAQLYNPKSLEIGNSLLGTLDEFKAMVDTAHAYGVKVIVILQEHSTYPLTDYQGFEDVVRKLYDRVKEDGHGHRLRHRRRDCHRHLH